MHPKEAPVGVVGSFLLLMFASAQASDPCHNYTVLNDSWRSVTNMDSATYRCDVLLPWQGWYRMYYQAVSVRMPETCVPPKHCGTSGPLWLNGPHPNPADGIVTRELCGSWDNNCCHIRSLGRQIAIRVKACPGDYFVYELVVPPYCYGYCTEPRTTFQQRLRLKMVFQRELSHAEMVQFSSQIREKLIQMGNRSDITVRMV